MSPDGGTVAYLSNRRNGVDFDLWACDLATRSHRSLYAEGGWCQPSSGFSPDGRWVAISRPGPRPLDEELVLVDVATGEARTVLAHPDEAAEVGPPLWWDSSTIFVSSNVSRDRAAIVRYNLSSGEHSDLAGGDWDTEPVTKLSGGRLVVVENRNGSSRIAVLDPIRARSRDAKSHWLSPALSYRTRCPGRGFSRWHPPVLHAHKPQIGRRRLGLRRVVG